MKFAILAVTMAIMAGVFHMMFIMYDYAFFNHEDGAFIQIGEKLNDTLRPEYRNQIYNQTQLEIWFFGVGRVACIAFCGIFFVVEVVTRRQAAGGE